MAVLKKDIENKVLELMNSSWDLYQNGNYDKAFEVSHQAWNCIPDPKESWYESFNIAQSIFTDYLNLKKYKEASAWLLKMKTIANNLHAWIGGELEFYEGKLAFEEGDLDKARDLFKIAMFKSEGRVFEDEPEKYRALLRKN